MTGWGLGELDGVTSKAWTTQDGKTREGRPIDKGHICKPLSNRTCLGELRHKDQWYQAEHPPIISRELWDSVHAILDANGRVRCNTTRAKVPYLLKGIVFGNDGRALSRHRVGTIGETDELTGGLEQETQRRVVLAPFERGVGVALCLTFGDGDVLARRILLGFDHTHRMAIDE
jgi:hypothetical protein